MTTRRALAVAALAVLVAAAPAAAVDPQRTFAPGTWVISPEGGWGRQFNLEHFIEHSSVEYWNVGVRVGLLPFGTSASGPLLGAFEVGVEPLYQRYVEPEIAYFAGFGVLLRYHFLALGRLVPYAEVAGFAGRTDLDIREIDSNFTFLVFGGAGASLFVADRTAIYAGYRLQHLSNGRTDTPNRGVESHLGVFGVSFYLDK